MTMIPAFGPWTEHPADTDEEKRLASAQQSKTRAAYFTVEKNHASYQRYCFSRSARTPRCNHCKARTGLWLS